MKLNKGTRTKIIVTLRSSLDPTAATIEVKIDDTWYPATWTGAAVLERPGRWVRTAETDAYFLGPDATGTGVTLTAGRHPAQTRATFGSAPAIVDHANTIVVD